MTRFAEYAPLIYGETVGWVNGRPVTRDLTPREYETLLSLVSHRKARVRWLTADRLGKIGNPQAVEPLIVALSDSYWLVRLHAAKALGRIGDPRAVAPLLEALADQCPYVRRRVVTALGLFGDRRIVRALVSALEDPDRSVRIRAVEGLGNIDSPETIPAIVEIARDGDAIVSWVAMSAFRGIGAGSTEALVALANDAEDEVRFRAIKTLGAVGDRRAIPTLTRVMNDPKESAKLRNRARLSLGGVKYRYKLERSATRRKGLAHWIRQWWPPRVRGK